MKKLNIEELLDKVDTAEIRKHQIFSDYGTKIWVHDNGTISVVGSGTIPNPNNNSVVAILGVIGRGNVDESYYAEGWATFDSEKDAYITDDGRTLSPDEMIAECLEDGDFYDDDEEIRNEIRRQMEQDS